MTRSFFKAALAALGSVAALAFSAPAASQPANYPSQPIRLVVAATPGGETDVIARLLAEGMQSRLNVSVFVDNKPGAGVGVGSGFVARAAPDGYTLLMAGSGLTVSPAILKTASDPVKDFTPISQILALEFYLAVRSDVKARTLPELVEWAKSRGDTNYGSAGPGSITHFQMEMLKSMAKLNAVHIPYKGTAPALNSLLAGDTQLMFVGYPAVPHFQSGALRPIAIAMPTRSKDFPQVPTVGEIYPGFGAIAWTGLVGPPNMPPAIVERLNAAVAAVVADPAFVARVKALGGQAASSTSQAMGERLRTETARYGALALSLGIKPE